MKVVHVLALISSSWGGPPRVVRDLTRAMGRLGVESVVVALTSRGSPPVKLSGDIRLLECGTAAITKLAVPTSMNLIRELRREVESADLVHIHELWHFPHVMGALVSLTLNRPYVITPHGELQPWPMTRHKFLKKIAWHSYERQIFRSCSGVHALTPLEKDAVETMCPGISVSVIPNGIDLSLIDDGLRAMASVSEVFRGIAEPYLLFVGRLAPEKGVDLLLEAFSILRRDRQEMSLVIVGPDELGLWGTLKQRAKDLGISRSINYLGTVSEPDKYRLFASAQAFLLPSLSEGLSVSLLEALACGTPAIVSTGCNLPVETIAGVPQARASSSETLSPSESEGRRNACAEAKRRYLSGSLTVPR